jgi:CTP:molybdopterin cytidylyltransferase MocA
MTHAVVLAAGTGSRFGGQKLRALLEGTPLIDHVLNATAHLPTTVVASPDLGTALGHPERSEQSERSRGTGVILNPAPEHGMAHSLRLANAAIDASASLLVLLADMPWITPAIVDAVIVAAGDADVCYPVRDGIGGHPVFFSPRARAKIPALPDGDSLRALRDDPGLTRATLPLESDAAYRDVDVPTDLP